MNCLIINLSDSYFLSKIPLYENAKTKEEQDFYVTLSNLVLQREAKKVRKKHNVADPIPRKKMKDKEIQESQQKTIKEINKNEKEIEELTNEINEKIRKSRSQSSNSRFEKAKRKY